MKNLLLILLSAFAISCDNNDIESTPEQTAMDLVTGMDCRQNIDDPPFRLGNPNILVEDKFVAYPNPATSTINILAQENISDVWILPADGEKIYQDVSFGSVLNPNLYSEQSLDSNSEISLSGQSNNQVDVNISGLEVGYYRVFVKIDSEIYWDNLYKYDSEIDNELEFAALLEFWE